MGETNNSKDLLRKSPGNTLVWKLLKIYTYQLYMELPYIEEQAIRSIGWHKRPSAHMVTFFEVISFTYLLNFHLKTVVGLEKNVTMVQHYSAHSSSSFSSYPCLPLTWYLEYSLQETYELCCSSSSQY